MLISTLQFKYAASHQYQDEHNDPTAYHLPARRSCNNISRVSSGLAVLEWQATILLLFYSNTALQFGPLSENSSPLLMFQSGYGHDYGQPFLWYSRGIRLTL